MRTSPEPRIVAVRGPEGASEGRPAEFDVEFDAGCDVGFDVGFDADVDVGRGVERVGDAAAVQAPSVRARDVNTTGATAVRNRGRLRDRPDRRGLGWALTLGTRARYPGRDPFGR
jgi:hypothetical protein